MSKRESGNHKSHKGSTGFERYYQGIYESRWSELRAALTQPVRQVARPNGFVDLSLIQSRIASLESSIFAGQKGFCLEPGTRLEPELASHGVFDFYVMDPASIFAARALEVQKGDEVLDLCAGPGGKSLILAEALHESGSLVSNELSDRRRGRLRAVLSDYIPKDMLGRVKVTGHDGTRWCLHETEAFDRVLVDAPCSGERHLLSDEKEMSLWSQARSKNLAVRQYALLASALAIVRVGGRIVYSTCSISPLENDLVIARLLKKRAGEVRVLRNQFEIGEATENGWVILPDRTGYGPIYFATLERVAVSD